MLVFPRNRFRDKIFMWKVYWGVIFRVNTWKAGRRLVGRREKLKWDPVTTEVILADLMGRAEAWMAPQQSPEIGQGARSLSLVITVGCPGVCITSGEVASFSQGLFLRRASSVSNQEWTLPATGRMSTCSQPIRGIWLKHSFYYKEVITHPRSCR